MTLNDVPPFAVQSALADASAAMQIADAALQELFDSLGETDADARPIGSYDVFAQQCTVQLFLRLLGTPPLIGTRPPPYAPMIDRYIAGRDFDERNAPGLELAALAIDFATGSLDDAIDALEKLDAEGELHETIVAAFGCLEAIRGGLESVTVRRRAARDGMN